MQRLSKDQGAGQSTARHGSAEPAHVKQSMDRYDDLIRFYALIERLRERGGGARRLANSSGLMLDTAGESSRRPQRPPPRVGDPHARNLQGLPPSAHALFRRRG